MLSGLIVSINFKLMKREVEVTKSRVIGLRLKALRNTFSKTQKEFAEILEVTQANISQMESGVCIPTGNFFLRLSEKFPETNFNFFYYLDNLPLRKDDEIRRKTEVNSLKAVFSKVNKENERLREDNSKLITLVSTKLKK